MQSRLDALENDNEEAAADMFGLDDADEEFVLESSDEGGRRRAECDVACCCLLLLLLLLTICGYRGSARALMLPRHADSAIVS
jgi:hypothetical protein